MTTYCTQNNGDCDTCSLVNYGLDCHNNEIQRSLPEDSPLVQIFGQPDMASLRHGAYYRQPDELATQ